MKYTIIDIETNGLLETVSIIHCMSYAICENDKVIEKGSITDYNEIIDFITEQKTLVGHNIIQYDIPVLEMLLEIKISARLIDTLAISWYLYPLRPKHGLEGWGDELGVPKPVIDDWENLSIQDYIHRCESDVDINSLLFFKQILYLTEIYGSRESIDGIINYLSFKLDCAREQEEVKCKVDIELVNKSLADLEELKLEKVNTLIESMPRNIKYKDVNKPSKIFKKDGTMSAAGIKWYNLLANLGLDEGTEGPVMVQVLSEPGNPSSNIQLKDWLYSLGWEPATFEHRKNSKGEVKAVPQIYNGDGVCDSIKILYELEPALESLDMLSLINHRIGVFKGYLANTNEEGYTTASVKGFTNTLRFRHAKPINIAVG